LPYRIGATYAGEHHHCSSGVRPRGRVIDQLQPGDTRLEHVQVTLEAALDLDLLRASRRLIRWVFQAAVAERPCSRSLGFQGWPGVQLHSAAPASNSARTGSNTLAPASGVDSPSGPSIGGLESGPIDGNGSAAGSGGSSPNVADAT